MPRPLRHLSLTTTAGLQSFAELKRAVQGTLITGQRKVDQAKLETYWRTGALIDRHLALHEEESGYGTRTMRRLAREVDFDESLLYRCLRFARTYPNFAGRRNLLWAHYRVLIDIEDSADRRGLEIEADRNGWTAEKLERRVRLLNAIEIAPAPAAVSNSSVPAPKPLTPKRGETGVCRVVANGDKLAVDLGFTAYADLPASTRLPEGSFVQLDADQNFVAATTAKKTDLYNYRAEILRVVDGDTLWVKIYLRPDLWIKEKLRLRGLDCPEMDTADGRAAKRFVEVSIARATGVTIATFKPDKYDRYLADVFLGGDGTDVFLNNELLANGHAARKDEYALTDWDGAR